MEDKLFWFSQICLAVECIHTSKIIHRDLKPENVFLDSAGIIKVGDFGCSKALSTRKSIASTFAGTLDYMAPEMLDENDAQKYTNKVDVWSLGVILYELIARYRPFDGKLGTLIINIKTKQPKDMPMHTTIEMIELLNQMLKKDPNQRPSIMYVLKHSLMQPYLK